MAIGPGQYDDLATYVRETSGAQGGVIVIIVDGTRGHGFAVQATLEVQLKLPTMLRDIADQIERSGGPISA